MAKKYNNDSISSLKGPDRVRKRPGVIFGSDDIEGCAHSFFEILSNSTDEAKAGYGNRIEVTRFKDQSIRVRDFGRGIPLDYNKKEERYNWELVYCELFAGGKYNSELYDFSLGLNGLGACATQYASEYFDVTSIRDGYEYSMHFEHGNPIGELKKKRTKSKETGTTQKWKPDIDVFTDINIPLEKFQSVLKEQAVVNAGVTFILDDEETGLHEEYCYPEGILGYIKELTVDTENTTEPYLFKGEGKGRDREDKPEYSVKASIAFCFNNKVQSIQYFHNSSNLEHGGSPEKAIKTAFVCSFDRYAKEQKKYTKNESKITFNDIADCLVIISNTFSEMTSYENQTKKAINNKFIQEFLLTLIKEQLSIWMIEHKEEADKVLDQILINKRSRESSESQRIQVKKKLMQKTDVVNKVKKFVDCRSKDSNERELFICLEGNTKVKLLNGNDVRIRDMVGMEDVWAYSTDEYGRMIPAKIKSVFKTRDVNDTVKIHFNNGTFVESTPEHKFLDADLKWVNAENCVADKVLASMRFKTADRAMVWVPCNGSEYGHWEEIGKRVARFSGLDIRKRYEHTDKNIWNNDPKNLVAAGDEPKTYEHFVERLNPFDLRVVEIEKIHYENSIPVYCLNIESAFHSFVLSNGVITHNCEGDSALGSLITARDANFQALMPIRGKILNIEKASLNQVFGSDVIMDLIRVFGCGIEVRGRKLPKDIPAFDIDKLNYNKIIIATDADVDGFHIATLITTMLYRLCPQLIEKGYLYIVETPLFEITERNGKNERIYFAYNDVERDRIIKGKDMKKITIQRSKGLGENSSEMMSKAISKGTRKLTRVTADTVEEMQYWFDLFMGNDVPPRKKYIEENGYLYMDDLDVS